MENLLGFIPGASTILGIINKIIETSCNYIDEAVLSNIYMVPGKNIWKNAAEGIVLYAQSWKKMVKAAAKVAFVVLIGKLVIFIVALLLVAAITKTAAVMIITALILAYLIGGSLIEPMATVVMIRAYHEVIAGQQISHDLYQKLQGVSSKFKTI